MPHGEDLGADLYALWAAGEHFFPEKAQMIARLDRDLAALERPLESEAAYAENPTALTRLIGLRDTLQTAMQRSSLLLSAVGDTLVGAANDLARTDEGAASRATQVASQLDELSTTIVRNVQTHWDALDSRRVKPLETLVKHIIDAKLLFPPHVALEHHVNHHQFHVEN